RQKIDRSGTVTFHDLVFGDITIEAKVLDDQILIKQDGMPTYNFANVIDDHLMQITHVVRGSEYLSSTPKYNLLYQAFGWDIPQYVHLPLIMGRDAEGNVSKLSKRHGSVSFENLVEEGFLPEAIINYIALLGWSSKTDREIFSLAELAELFSVDGLNKAAAIFDYDKLRWMNSEYIKQMNFEDFKAKAAKFAPAEFAKLEKVWDKVASLLQSRLENFTDIPSMVAFLIEQPAYEVELFNHKKNKATPESAKEIICDVMPEFEKCENWNAESLTAILMNYAQTRELKVGKVMWGVRIALSGQSVTPGGPGEIMEIIGREKSFARLNAALAKIG
ncbi:MAG: glutamate--tRNA ligase, partial [Lentisphaeria bacterium]|nr:glutamate--tRNA ligase [Lentisphaeria bacterium]